MASKNSFGAASKLDVGGQSYRVYSLKVMQAAGYDIGRLPYSIRILLENLLRFEDEATVKRADIEYVAKWDVSAAPQEINYRPARVVLQDFTGVPCVVDLAAMRDALQKLGADPTKANPLIPCDLVIDHSVQVDYFGAADSFDLNVALEPVKFPLENYNRMFEGSDSDRALAQKQFRADLRKHVDAIASKYIIENETSDGAVMFVPAEAVFAEIHAYHAEVVDYANRKRVWIVSPTTLMAVLNTARAVLKDVETRKQIHVIKEALSRLGQDFRRFDERMKKLADHIRQAHQDAEDVQTSSRKISQQFQNIESAELEAPEPAPSNVVRLPEERKPSG